MADYVAPDFYPYKDLPDTSTPVYSDDFANPLVAAMLDLAATGGRVPSIEAELDTLGIQPGTASLTPHPTYPHVLTLGATSPVTATVPTAPSITGVTPGPNQVAVAFLPPSSNGGATITGYTVTASPGGATATGTTSPITVTGLTNGQAYTFTVKATNSAGTGPASAASGSATPAAAAAGGSTSGANSSSPGTSTPARWQINFGGAPTCRVTWETGVVSGQCKVVWVGSMPDVRARTTRLETGVAAQAQDAFQAYIQDLTTGATVADSGITLGTAENWTATSFTPVAGRRYKGWARVRAADGQWSAYAGARFVAPTGVTRYFEDFGMVGDGTTRSGTDYGAGTPIFTGPLRTAIAACNPGDVLTSNAPGTRLTGLTVSGTAISGPAGTFTGRTGQKIMIYGAGTQTSAKDAALHRTTIASVAGGGASATLTAAVSTNITGTAVALVNYPEFWVGHIDMDAGANSQGGVTIRGTGCLFTSLDPNYAGFRTSGVTDMTYEDIHYWSKNVTVRDGAGQNNNHGPWFVENAATVGTRIIRCRAEHSRAAAFLVYGGPTDWHVVDCIADHSLADPFHVTGTASDGQFIRPTGFYVGDDGSANIGYRADGDANRPQRITWESPAMYGQDWGRGLSFGGCKDILATDVVMDHGAGASFLIGADTDQANTTNVQIRRFTVTAPTTRAGLTASYSQGGSPGTVGNDAKIKLLSRATAVRQSNILIEDGTINDAGFAVQVVCDGGGAFQDGTVTIRGVALTGTISAGANWCDQNTYPGHLDFRGITVPAGSTPAVAPTAANS